MHPIARRQLHGNPSVKSVELSAVYLKIVVASIGFLRDLSSYLFSARGEEKETLLSPEEPNNAGPASIIIIYTRKLLCGVYGLCLKNVYRTGWTKRKNEKIFARLSNAARSSCITAK